MKTPVLSILAVSCTLALVACAGNSKDSGSSATPTVGGGKSNTTITTPKPSTQNTQPSAMSFVSNLPSGTQAKYLVEKPTGTNAEQIQQAINYTNQLRAEKGLSALQYDANLSAYAQVRAKELVTLFSHTRPDGTDALDYVFAGAIGENIAGGRGAKDTVMGQWKNSAGHYQNMIGAGYSKIGIGMVYIPNSEYGYYWVQIFGSKNATTSFDFSSTANNKPLEQVIVNGVTIPVPQQKSGEWTTINQQGYTAQVNGHQSMKFGAVKRNNTNDVHVFYQGLQTAESAMPTTGKAQYSGQAVVVKNGQMNTNVKANFDVDYGNKTLNGALSENNTTLYNLNANISGSSFASTNGAKVQTQGAFFGDKAQELGGVFNDTQNNAKGAFGAVKK